MGAQTKPSSRFLNTTDNKTRIKVFCRCRPLLDDEKGSPISNLSIDHNAASIHVKQIAATDKNFTFDEVFGENDSQEHVFNSVAKEAIDDVFIGYHATIFAYGQTGTGKTYTMSSFKSGEEGIIPRAVNYIFDHISKDDQSEYIVHMNYVQIYMEMIQDLLEPENKNLAIREDPDSGIYISGVCSHKITSPDECLNFYRVGDENRVTALTKMNATSSRSHSCLIIQVEKRLKFKDEDYNADTAQLRKVTKANLFLVDLAGSERLKKTEATGIRKKEAGYINMSLTNLGNVIQALERNQIHIPFRDSKLTRLLQDSLGGHGKTRVIVNIGPCDIHTPETISTLMFGQRAMKVKTVAKINETVDYKALSLQLQSELDQLEIEFRETEKDLDELLNENESLENKLRMREQEVRCLNEEMVQLSKGGYVDVKQVQSNIEEKVAMAHRAKEQELQTRISQLEAEMKVLSETYQRSAEREQELKATLLNYEAQISDITLQKKQLEVDLQESQSDVERANEKEQEMKTALDSIEKQINEVLEQKELEISTLTELHKNEIETLIHQQSIDREENEMVSKQYLSQLESERAMNKDRLKNLEVDLTTKYETQLENLKQTVDVTKHQLEATVETYKLQIDKINREWESTVQNCGHINEDLKQRLEQQDKENTHNMSQLQKKMDNLMKELSEKHSQLSEVTEEVETMQQQHQLRTEALQSKISRLVSKLTHKTQIIEQQDQTVEELYQSTESLEKTIAVLREENESLRSKNSQLEGDVESLSKTIEKLNNDISLKGLCHSQDIQSMSASITEKSIEIVSLKDEIESLLSNHKMEKASLEGQIESLTLDLKSKDQKHSKEVEELTQAISAKTQENKELKDGISKLHSEYDKERDALQTQIESDLVKSEEKHYQLLQDIEDLKAAHKAEIAKLEKNFKQELNAAQNQILRVEQEVNLKELEIEFIDQEMSQLQDKISASKDAEYTDTIMKLKAKVTLLTDELADSSEELACLQEKNHTLENQVSKYQDIIKKTEQEHRSILQKCEELEMELSQEKSNRETLELKSHVLKKTLQQLQSALD